MRVHVQLFLAAVAITHTIKAEPTTFVGVSKNNSSTESSSTAAKTTTFATGSPTKPSEESINTAGRDDGERMFERLSEMVEKAKDAVRSKLGNVVAKTDIVQPEGYETFSEVATKHQKDSVSAFAELKKKFDLARLIVAAKKGSTPNDAVLELEKAQMEYWLNNKISSHDAFGLLKLNKAEDGLASPLFSYWITYVKRFNKGNAGESKIVFDILMSEFGDVALARLIVAAKKGSTPNIAVLRLEKAQMKYWLKEKMISAYDVFVLLKLNKADENLLTNPLFPYWSRYVKRFNKDNAGVRKSVLYILMLKYGNEDLARLIVAAKKGSTPNIDVLGLEKAQMDYWLNNKISAYDVFVLLKLNKADDNLLTHPLFPYWSTYVKRVSAKYHQKKLSVVDILTPKYYSDVDLARLIVAAKKGSTPNDAVLELEKAQMEYWLNNKISSHDAFGLLKLNKAEDGLASPLFSYWITYVKRFNKGNAGESKIVFDVLMSEFGDVALARLIVNAKKNKENEEINKNAVALGEEQLKYWLRKGESIDEVFEMLRLHTVEDSVLTNPVFNQWYSYFEMVNKKHGNKESVIDFLSSKKGTSFEDFMKDELEKANLGTKSRVDELFVDLRLERVGDGLFTDPLFIFWRACLEKFNGAHPKKSRTSVIQSLRTVYGDKGLADLIRAEEKVTKSSEYASRLENDLCATWLSDGKSLDDVFKFLDLNRADYKLLENPSMKTFAKITQFFVSMDSKELPMTKEASFEEHEILRGIKIASGTGGLRTTTLEKALFRLWFTQKKHPEEVYKMYFGQDKLSGILKDEGNLFEIPLFITFVKYSEGYSRTRSLAIDDDVNEVVRNPENKKWGTDPTNQVNFVVREFKMPLVIEKEFKDKMDKLGEMIMSVKESSSNSVKASSSKPMKESSSNSALFAVKQVEDALFIWWNQRVTPDLVFKKLQLNTKMAPAELFENPSFRWWIDYMDSFFTQAKRTEETGKTLMEVFEPSTNLVWLRNAREEKTTKELADRVWTNLLKEHLQANTSPEKVKKNLMIPPIANDDEVDLQRYSKALHRRKTER
ncbi:unnamed protein product [Peronospora farinosa]|uniref:RxLR effector PexRD54 WY domain-containing protein n=1 Tax=Peronospora farinosa TaxID=134698 RepID=A0AAV0TX08_9STRA|nr:unnamed protein product [Peronospora farinosa]